MNMFLKIWRKITRGSTCYTCKHAKYNITWECSHPKHKTQVYKGGIPLCEDWEMITNTDGGYNEED